MSSEVSSVVSSFCLSFCTVTLIRFPYLSLRMGFGVSVSVSSVSEVDMESGLVWGVLMLLFLSSFFFSFFFYFCLSPCQSSTSTSTSICSLVSFSSSSESDHSDLRGKGYSVGHCFPGGVHFTQYPGDFWVWLDKVTNGG